jgi:hypothetical protein
MRVRTLLRRQFGAVPVIVIVIIVVVVIAVIGAITVASSEPTPPTPGTPPDGCYPAATQCRLFIQNEVACCSGQPVVGKRIGWCLGWWDALPCTSH